MSDFYVSTTADTQVPLIWTSKGNLPTDQLEHETEWDVQDTYIKFVERYRLDGEIVKESAHVYDKSGLYAKAVAADIA